MKTILSTIILFSGLLFVSPLKAQQCFGANIKEGSGAEMASYNAKGKLSGTMKFKYVKVTNSGGGVVVDIAVEHIDGKGKSQTTQTYQMRCNGNEIQIDGASLITEQQREAFKDYKMKFTSDDLVIPQKLSVGQTLKDASVKGEGGPEGQPNMFKISMDTKNRKIESQESLTVPAGTFNVFKITSDIHSVMQMGFPIKFQMQSVSYRDPNTLWDIKSETYSRGKLVGYTVLTKVF